MRAMRRTVTMSTLCAALGAMGFGCEPSGAGPGDGGPGGDSGGEPARGDADGDGIADEFEGRATEADTDADGTPDYLDTDSDGDGIPDSVEGDPDDSSGRPVDSDSDGTPDFQDTDSDGNGVPDADEPEGDADGDGVAEYADLDDDGDGISDADEIGDPAAPLDTDGDGLPDYRDSDSDGDTIGDVHESIPDTDGDGALDRHDLDSDDDGWTDAEEAGDADPATPPVDTDGDTIPDFRDTDSDGDGLSDTRERELGTARDSADTDGDGVSDLVEVSACPAMDPSCASDATDPMSSPRERGDFVFAMPYRMPPMPPRDTLVFATDIRVADVYFLIDTTGSMTGPIGNVRSSLSTPGSGIIARVRGEIPDVWFGIGNFKDYNATPRGGGFAYGSGSDYAYRHDQDLTMSTADAQAAVNSLSASGGADGPESHGAALWATATGMGLSGPALPGGGALPPRTDCPMGTWGYPCFRDGAVPIVVLISDIVMHNGPGGSDAYEPFIMAPTFPEVVTALTASRVRVIGVSTGSTAARMQMEQLATMTGAVDGSGAPLVTTASGGTVSDAVVNQIAILANQTPIDVSVEFVDDPSDAVDTFAAFVDRLEANEAGDPARGCDARGGEDTDGDGYPDTFRDVTPGDPVCFDIVVRQNDTVEPLPTPQLFQATLRVLGDGFTELDTRDIFFLVPPEIEPPMGPM